MNPFDKFPRTIKKTIRYIIQDLESLEKLEQIEKTLLLHIEKRK